MVGRAADGRWLRAEHRNAECRKHCSDDEHAIGVVISVGQPGDREGRREDDEGAAKDEPHWPVLREILTRDATDER